MFLSNVIPVEFDSTTQIYYFLIFKTKYLVDDIKDDCVEEDVVVASAKDMDTIEEIKKRLIEEKVCNLEELYTIKYKNILFDKEYLK